MKTDASERWISLADSFMAAGVGSASWADALAGLAAESGSQAGQLIGFGTSPSTHFNWVVDPEPEWIDDFVTAGGADPSLNPRLTAGLRIPVLQTLTDADVITKEERRRNPFYAEFLERYDRPFLCAATVYRENDVAVGLAVLRSFRNGEIEPDQRALFAAIAPHARGAVRAQIALENQGALLLAGALEALSITAFICDRTGKVRAMTPSAEALVGAGDTLNLVHGQLRGSRPEHTMLLADALRRAAGGLIEPGSIPSSTVVLPQTGGTPVVLDVISLPVRPYALGFEPRALVVVRAARHDPNRTSMLLQAAYRLTPAEAAVAMRLAEGHSIDFIAAERAVSVGTVRVQLRAIFGKLGVRRQGELVVRVGQLG